MFFQQFEKWLQCQVLKKDYKPDSIKCLITQQFDQFIIKDAENRDYKLQPKPQFDLQISNTESPSNERKYTCEINDYLFNVDYDMKQDIINKVEVESEKFYIILNNDNWDAKIKKYIKMLSVRQEFQNQNNQDKIEKIQKNFIEELKSVESQQQEKQKTFTPQKITENVQEQQEAEIIEPFHLQSDIKKQPIQQEIQENVQNDISNNLHKEKQQEPQKQLFQITIPENMQQEAEVWIKNRKKERYHDLKYYQKLVLLQKSLSKNQVTQNLLKYPYQPTEDLKKRMIPFLTRSSDSEILQKKVKFTKTIIESLKPQ